MQVLQTKIQDVLIIKPKIFSDDRGKFLEKFNLEKYENVIGRKLEFVQDNHSISKKSILRGLHFQSNKPQGKLISVSLGEVFDVVVDIRKNSKTYKMWEAFRINSDNMEQIWIPPGLAHGFLAISEEVHFNYKCTDYYYPENEHTINWNDPDLNIKWPITNPILSKKDSNGISINEV